jgi:hypothetical protein
MEELESYNNEEEAKIFVDSEGIRAKFWLLRLLGKAYNIMAYIYKSLKWIMIFKNFANRMILMDNCTRWNN